jgi:16S rRNA (guanine527-N7)-methyltransferase
VPLAPVARMSDESQRLHAGARALGVALSLQQGATLLRLLDELEQWNRAYNLTAVTDRSEMLDLHLLDSLSASAALKGERIADVGTGAGFPGLPLAVLHPKLQFTLLDSNGKKIRFVAHVVRTLGLANVQAVQSRAEALRPAAPFDTVLARAVAPLPKLLNAVRTLCATHTRVVALKGRLPAAELAGLPAGWQLLSSRAVQLPGVAAERHVLTLGLRAS